MRKTVKLAFGANAIYWYKLFYIFCRSALSVKSSLIPQIAEYHAWKTNKMRNYFVGALTKRDDTDTSKLYALTIIPHFAGFFNKVWGLEIKILNFPKEIPHLVGFFRKCSKMASESEEFLRFPKFLRLQQKLT